MPFYLLFNNEGQIGSDIAHEYVAEDGVTNYVAEDGVTFYIAES